MDGENEENDDECEEKENQAESASAMYGPQICQEKDTDTTTTVCKICYKYKMHQTSKPNEDVVKTVNVTKKTRVEDEKTTTSTDQMGKKWTNAELNFPLGDVEHGHACLVKIYDRFDEFKLNDMVEFVGILSQDPSLAYEHDEHTHFMESDAAGLIAAAASSVEAHQDEWQPQRVEEERREENKTETFKLVDDRTDQDGGAQNGNGLVDHAYCKCAADLIDISVTRQVKHMHSHKKVVLSSYPPSLVPRLHCVLSYKLSHNNPLLTRSFFSSKSKHNINI